MPWRRPRPNWCARGGDPLGLSPRSGSSCFPSAPIWRASGSLRPRRRGPLLRTLIEEATLHVDRHKAAAQLALRWKAGALSHLTVALPRSGSAPVRTDEDTVTLLRRLAPHYADAIMAGILTARAVWPPVRRQPRRQSGPLLEDPRLQGQSGCRSTALNLSAIHGDSRRVAPKSVVAASEAPRSGSLSCHPWTEKRFMHQAHRATFPPSSNRPHEPGGLDNGSKKPLMSPSMTQLYGMPSRRPSLPFYCGKRARRTCAKAACVLLAGRNP